MSHKVVTSTLAVALAASDTLALSYPSGTDAGSFVGSVGHVLVTGSGDVFKSPQYFTLSFGASSITLTWGSSSPTLPVNTIVNVQLEMRGSSPQRTNEGANPALKRTAATSLKVIDLGAPDTADDDGVAASQTVTGAGTAFSLNGALVTGGKAVFDRPRNVVAAWTNTAVLTITGKDEYGNTMVEASASGTSHTGKKAFKEVTSVTTSATVTSATVGSGVVLGLPVFLPSKQNIVGEYQSGVLLPRIGGEVVYLTGLQTEANVDAGTSLWLPCPVAGNIRKLTTIQQGGVTTGGAVTLEVNTAAVNGLSVTVADSSAAGDVDSDTPTYGHASTAVAVGDSLEVVFASAFNASADVLCVIEIEATKDTHGTTVVGNASAAQSSTSADVRGTYAPAATPDGSISFSLLVELPDPNFVGFDQYAG